MKASSCVWRLLVLAGILSASVAARGEIIDLLPKGESGNYSAGDARGVYFDMGPANLSISSLGIEAPLTDKTFDVLIYVGDTKGASLTPETASLLDVTPVDNGSWFDVALSYTFLGNQDYTLLWRPHDGISNTWSGPITLYNLLDLQPSDATPIKDSFDNTILTLIGGRSGVNGATNNATAPRFRFNGPVPEPTVGMLLLMMGGAVLVRRRHDATLN